MDQYLECEPVEIRWGCRYGPNPREAYAGDPHSEKKGWGCFAPVIQKALAEAAGKEYTAQNLTGMSLPSLTLYALIMQTPVAVWTTVDMKEVDKICQWQSADGEESFLYPANQHCMVLVGMDMENYYFRDPKMESGDCFLPEEAGRSGL